MPPSRWRGSAGAAHYAGPLGDLTTTSAISSWPRWRARASTPPAWCACQGATAPVSGIMVDAAGERMIVTHRDQRIESRADRRSRPSGGGRVAAARRQSLSGLGAAGVRGGAAARHSGGARRRPADGRGRSAVRDSDPRDLLVGMPARHHRRRRSLRRPAAHGAADEGIPRGQRRRRGGAVRRRRRGADACRCSRSTRSIRSRPATCSTPASRWRWPRARDPVAAMRFGARPRPQMHALRRQHGRADARRGRGVPGEAAG